VSAAPGEPRRKPRPVDPDIAASVQAATHAALDKKATDLKVLHLGAVTDFTDFFLVASATNQRQVEAISDAVLHALRGRGVRPLHAEGLSDSNWVLLDFGDFVVHIFDEETRGFYALERLWSDAPDLTKRFTRGTASPAAAETP
jgi:ribosome-associated protein